MDSIIEDISDPIITTSTEISITESESPIPTPLFSDYVEMVYLGLVLIIGVPINIHVLFKLLKQKEKTARYSVKRGFLILKIHLNLSDTLILFINAGGKLGWLITYEWKAGEGMCRIFKFVSIGTLYLSSNIVVCIALDRLRTVLSARQLRRENSVLPTKIILILAWLLAIASSIPQYFAFQSFDVLQYSTETNENWYQCTDIWSVNDHLVKMGIQNATEEFPFTEITKNFHELFHLFMVFYGPLIVMAVCYFIIAVKLTNYSKGHPHSAGEGGVGGLPKSKYLKPAITYDLDETSEISRISLDSAYGDLKHGKLTMLQFLKKEFSYCICCVPAPQTKTSAYKPGGETSTAFPRVPSRNNIIHEDPISTASFGAASTNLFTWTPLLQNKKLGNESRSPSFNNRIQRLTLRRTPPGMFVASFYIFFTLKVLFCLTAFFYSSIIIILDS